MVVSGRWEEDGELIVSVRGDEKFWKWVFLIAQQREGFIPLHGTLRISKNAKSHVMYILSQ